MMALMKYPAGVPWPAAASSDLELLRDRIEELEEELRQLKDSLKPKSEFYTLFPRDWQLTKTQARYLGLLYKTPGMVTRERILTVANGPGHNLFEKTVDVHMYLLRKKLRPHGITIDVVRGVGFELSDQSRARVQRAMLRVH